MLTHFEMVARIGAGAALGGVIGYERDRHGRPVGLRTHLLVALTAATFMVLSSQFVYFQHYKHGELVEVDSSRIAASVVSGIGFLAGGAILRTGLTIQGLTTAAGLWLVTAIGMCSGAGMFVEALSVTGMGIVALTVLRRFEDKDDHVVHRRLSVILDHDATANAAPILAVLTSLGIHASVVEYEQRLDDVRKPRLIVLDLKLADDVNPDRVMDQIQKVAGVRRIRLRDRV
jgi:putative Mg2+ transporter-C (MgtC) family protein